MVPWWGQRWMRALSTLPFSSTSKVVVAHLQSTLSSVPGGVWPAGPTLTLLQSSSLPMLSSVIHAIRRAESSMNRSAARSIPRAANRANRTVCARDQRMIATRASLVRPLTANSALNLNPFATRAIRAPSTTTLLIRSARARRARVALLIHSAGPAKIPRAAKRIPAYKILATVSSHANVVILLLAILRIFRILGISTVKSIHSVPPVTASLSSVEKAMARATTPATVFTAVTAVATSLIPTARRTPVPGTPQKPRSSISSTTRPGPSQTPRT